MQQKFVGDVPQLFGKLRRILPHVAARVAVEDRLDGVDMLVHQPKRQLRDVRRMLDQAAQAVGDGRDQRIAEGRRLTLDVVRGAEQHVLVARSDAGGLDGVARRIEAHAFVVHPHREIRREFRERGFRALHRIEGGLFAGLEFLHRLLELVRRHDHFMIGEGRDRSEIGLLLTHRAGPVVTPAFSSSGGCLITSALPPLRRSVPA